VLEVAIRSKNIDHGQRTKDQERLQSMSERLIFTITAQSDRVPSESHQNDCDKLLDYA
jgi:hypothetical protein